MCFVHLFSCSLPDRLCNRLCINSLRVYLLQMPPPVLDNLGRIMSEGPPDEWPARSGVALAINKMSPHISEDQVETLFEFFIQKAVGDRNEDVRKHMLDAAVAVVNDHGKVRQTVLFDILGVMVRQLLNERGHRCVMVSKSFALNHSVNS